MFIADGPQPDGVPTKRMSTGPNNEQPTSMADATAFDRQSMLLNSVVRSRDRPGTAQKRPFIPSESTISNDLSQQPSTSSSTIPYPPPHPHLQPLDSGGTYLLKMMEIIPLKDNNYKSI